MTEHGFWLRLWPIVGLAVLLPIIGAIVHNNHARYMLERDCMAARGNWESRQGSASVGCRFATVAP